MKIDFFSFVFFFRIPKNSKNYFCRGRKSIFIFLKTDLMHIHISLLLLTAARKSFPFSIEHSELCIITISDRIGSIRVD